MRKATFGLLMIFYVSGYANYPFVRNFSKTNYKAGTQNWSIMQDENNKMYFANNNGVLEYDGSTWTTTPLLTETSVRDLLHTKDGRFYISTFNDFGYFIRQNNAFVYTSLADKLGINKEESNALYKIIDGKKDIYFQGEKNIFKYDGSKIDKIKFFSKIDASAYINDILILTSSKTGAFLMNGKQFMRMPGSEILINKKVCSIIALDNQRVLFVTNFNGAYIYNGITFSEFKTSIDVFLKSNQVFCATKSNNLIAFGTVQKGVAILNLTDKSVTYMNSNTGIQNNTVLSVFFDKNQNLWLGLDKGIDYVILNTPIRNLLGINNLYGTGYTSLIKDNTLYLGTNQGLYSTPYSQQNSIKSLNLKKGMEGQVWCLTEIDNTLFCGEDQGAFIIRNNAAERIDGLTGTWNFKSITNHPNLILGCSYNGLFILKKIANKWTLSHYIKGNFHESSPMFEIDSQGSIWFSHWQKGLFHLKLNNEMDSIISIKKFNKNNGLPSNRNNTVFKIGNELVFSSENGFFKYNPKTDRMDSDEKWNNLFSSTPSYIRLHEAKNGDVWCVSGRFIGLATKLTSGNYSMDSITYRLLQPKIVIGFEHFNFIDKNNIIFGTEDGFSLINTSQKAKITSNFKVSINSIIAMSSIQNKNKVRKSYFNPTQKAEIPKYHNSVLFNFSAPEYRNENSVEYSYMLENYENDWSEFSSTNSKEYTKLPRGKYILKIKARNPLEKNIVTCTYEFTILPAWYESTLAFIIYIIILIIIIVYGYKWINIKSIEGAREMEEIKEIEIQEQKKVFEAENQAKKREIKELKNQQLQYELRHKAQELASSTMNLIRKNEMLAEIMGNINKATDEIKKNGDVNAVLTRLGKMERNIKQSIEQDKNWKRFEENFDLVYENYIKRLGESYPELNISDKKICAYIKMDLSSKDMAPLLNMSVRSIETNRYRIRQKLALDREVNLADFLQKF